jgi:hypothetical protein
MWALRPAHSPCGGDLTRRPKGTSLLCRTRGHFYFAPTVSHVVGGYVVFGQLPDGWTLAGATIIIGSGLYVLWREQVRAREARVASTGA